MLVSGFNVSGQSPSVVTTSGTSTVYFSRPQSTIAGSASPLAGPTATNATGQLALPVPAVFNENNGMRLRIVASGTFTVGASLAATITIQANTGTLSSPAYTTLMTASNTPGAAGTFPWNLEGHFVVGGVLPASSPSVAPVTQVTTGQLVGFYIGSINGSLVDLAIMPATTNPVTWGQSGFAANVTFGTGNAGNAATLNQFQIVGD